MAYDPNWLTKLQAKKWAQQERDLSHIVGNSYPNEPFRHSTMLCGKGWGAKGHPSICVVQFPSVTNLPGCRTCREMFLTSIGVPFDSVGYPYKYMVLLNDRPTYTFHTVADAVGFTNYWNAVPLFSFDSL